jgi:hypothetical protein
MDIPYIQRLTAVHIPLGYDKVYPLLQVCYYWLGMLTDILDWLKACLSYQQIKHGSGKGKLPLHQAIAQAPMEIIAMDKMSLWPRTPSWKEYVVLDYISKGVEAWALQGHIPANKQRSKDLTTLPQRCGNVACLLGWPLMYNI